MLDWQAVRLGPPLIDDGIYLSSCLSPEDRRAHEDDLLRGYHDGLVAAGVRDFTFEDCLESYRSSSLYTFLLTVGVSVTLEQTERDDEMFARPRPQERGPGRRARRRGVPRLTMAIPAPQPGSAALITGASSGIGRELRRQLCERGHDVVLVARRRELLEQLAGELRERHGRRVEVIAVRRVRARPLATRSSSRSGRSASTVDVLVLCAGFGMGGPFTEQDPERVQLMMRTNVEGDRRPRRRLRSRHGAPRARARC